LKLEEECPDFHFLGFRHGAFNDLHRCGRIPIFKQIENPDGCGINDQHAASDDSAMAIA
jgi:hypothetical protein